MQDSEGPSWAGCPSFCGRQEPDRRPAEVGSIAVQVRWRRVVLDEAHSIKDRRCSTARAVFALTSKYKWALSGTPLQVRALPAQRPAGGQQCRG